MAEMTIASGAGVERTVHLMPFQAARAGPANVAAYFTPHIAQQPDGSLTSSFRGRLLRGAHVALPEGYTGKILRETSKGTQNRQAEVVGSFKSFTYWNLETPPRETDNIRKALGWIELAKAIHDP
eukprot:m.66002 g.66002  ORF g.66002 m.66002 type:complete len:125 (-) comp49838_c0_seq1:9-383(-)